jgi:hypothetical protein
MPTIRSLAFATGLTLALTLGGCAKDEAPAKDALDKGRWQRRAWR